MLNYIWLALVLLSVLLGGVTGHLDDVTKGAFDGAKTAVMSIALPLVGTLCRLAGHHASGGPLGAGAGARAGVAAGDAAAVSRRARRPSGHGRDGDEHRGQHARAGKRGHAAGLRAMSDLERLNPHPGTATNAMCTFLAINTSSVQLIPATAVAILAANGAKNPTAIVGHRRLLPPPARAWRGSRPPRRWKGCRSSRRPRSPASPVNDGCSRRMFRHDRDRPDPTPPLVPPIVPGGWLVLVMFGLLCRRVFRAVPASAHGAAVGDRAGAFFVQTVGTISLVAVPLHAGVLPALRGVARDQGLRGVCGRGEGGFSGGLRIIPFLVAMLVAIGMFRGSGGMDFAHARRAVPCSTRRFPADLLPMVLMRPLSGSGTQGLFTDVVTHFGPDSVLTRTAGTIYGSTETTFYVVAVYFGAVAVRRTRHAIAAGLIADATGVVASVVVCRLMFGHG